MDVLWKQKNLIVFARKRKGDGRRLKLERQKQGNGRGKKTATTKYEKLSSKQTSK